MVDALPASFSSSLSSFHASLLSAGFAWVKVGLTEVSQSSSSSTDFIDDNEGRVRIWSISETPSGMSKSSSSHSSRARKTFAGAGTRLAI